MKKLTKTGIIIYTAMVVLIVILLMVLGVKSNTEVSFAREGTEPLTVPCVSVTEISRSDAPLGYGVEYKLDLSSVQHNNTLAFYSFNNYVEAYIDGELVYSLMPSAEISKIKTTGSNWNLISVCHEDSGKDCTVVLMPVYENVSVGTPEFMLGSVYGILLDQLSENMFELILTVIVILIAVLFIIIGFTFVFKTRSAMNFIALGNFALAVGLWRFFDFYFTPLLMGGKDVLVYYLSLIMLMVSPIAMLEAMKNKFSKEWQKVFNMLSIAISVAAVVQLTLQLLGVFDLRQMLFITHLSLFAGILLILVCIVLHNLKTKEKNKRYSMMFILILGISVDLILYYTGISSSGLIFAITVILLFILFESVRLILGYIDQREKLGENEVKLAQNETKLAQAQFTTMMSQIRSHFIFNILNAISGMCKYDPEKADRTIVHFARFLRSNIDIMQNDDLVHFHNALRHLEDYVALEQVRYGDNIQFVTDLQEDNFMLPPLVMQPIVENSIKHGLVSKPHGGTVTLRTRKDENNIYVIIEDDGIGYDSDMQISEKSIGLQNIRFRLAHMVKGDLKIESIVNVGTKATITIPRKEAEQCG